MASGGGDNSVRLFCETPGGIVLRRQIGAAESAHEDEVNGVACIQPSAACSRAARRRDAKIWRDAAGGRRVEE